METQNTQSTWYQHWFGKHYLELYPHRNRDEARRQVEFLLNEVFPLPLPPEFSLLDIACGPGRHVEAFRRAGVEAYGIDLSKTLLEVAKKQLRAAKLVSSQPTVQIADMRELPFSDNRFHCITSFFTSFGYFDSDLAHHTLLKEWHRVLRSRGMLVIDYLNREKVIKTLVTSDSKESNTNHFRMKRSLSKDKLRVEKEIIVTERASGETHRYLESVRMYKPEELFNLLTTAGFKVTSVFGGFSGETFSEDSDRLLVVAESSNRRVN